ncbi:MAG: caspase family protein [Archangiaceae bacterium]|nr:caspase family protein [Archangiaceae bacterium]
MSAPALAALLLAAAGPAERAQPRLFALVVGLNSSRDPKVAPLRYADDDAARYFELFEALGAQPKLLAVLDADTQRRHPALAAVARPPSRAELDRAIHEIAQDARRAQQAGEQVEFFFAYAGHGNITADREGYVNLVDSVLLRRELFSAVLEPVPATYKHVIIDACNAYFLVAKRGAATEAQLQAVKAFLDREALDAHPEVGVLVSGTKEVETHEWAALESGVFSHEIRSALLGAADADGDGYVRYAEIAAFVAAANDGLSDPRARVDVFARPPALDLSRPVLDLRRGSPRYLEVPPQLKGRWRVEDARGARYADFNASGERSVFLKLVGESEYFAFFEDDREAKVRASKTGGIAQLALSSLKPKRSATRGAVEDDLRKGLFTIPYGAGFLRGFVSSNPSAGVVPPPSAPFAPFPEVGLERTEVAAPSMPLPRRLGWVSMGLAVAFGSTSAIAALQTRSGYDGFLTQLAEAGTYSPNQVRAIENWRLVTNLALVGAVGTAALGLLLLFLSDGTPQ